MKSLLLAGLLVVQSVTAAQAMDWSGSYFGVEGSKNWTTTFSYISTSPTSAEYWSIGLVGGYLWNVDGGAVLGVEAEIGAYDDGMGRLPVGYLSFNSTRLYGSISARAGVPYERFLPYVSVGLRATFVDMNAHWQPFPGVPAIYSTINGFGISPAMAAGMEMAITDMLSVKAELSTVLGNVRLEQDNGALSDFRPHAAANLGLNFHF